MALSGSNSKMSDEKLKEVGGGYLYSPEGTCQTQVINDKTGEVMATFFTRGEAIEYAQANGQRASYISDTALEALRKKNNNG